MNVQAVGGIEPYPTWERKQREAEELAARDMRDQFAMAALQGQKLPENKTEAATLARLCYFIADAMMARRDK